MRKLVLFLLFVSGFSSLMYQILFTRLFNIAFGLFIHSTVVVVGTYMLGLGLGYFLSRNFKPNNHLLFYGYLEMLVGVYSAIVFLAFNYIDLAYTALGNFFLVKFILSSLVLILPTTAMGMTIPVLVEYLKRTENRDLVDKVYGINALGAGLGAGTTSVLFINLFGLGTTFAVAFLLNLIVLISTIIITKSYVPSFEITKSSFSAVNTGWVFGIVAFLFGFCGMALEILWYRLLVYFVANNTFSFSIILSVVIIGIALGALLYKPLLKVIGNDLALLTAVSFFTGTYLVASVVILNSSYHLIGGIYTVIGNLIFSIFGDTKFSETISLLFTRYIFVLLVSGVISLASGIIIPSLFSLVKGKLRTEADSQSISGTILAINTLGSIVGVISVTYLMIPIFGFSGSILLISLIYLASGITIASLSKETRVFSAVGALIGAVLVLIPKEITFTKYYNGFWNIKGELKFYREGMYGTVAVFDVGKTRFLKINGIDEVPSDFSSLVAFKVLGNIPFILKGHNSDVMVNALGGGITLSSTLHHITTQNISVVDICPDVVGALHLYTNYNYNVFSKPVWKFVADDGRNFLKSHKGLFDIIIADATHPASSDSWMLFTKEFYTLAFSKLKDGGIFVQWIPLHNLEVYDFVSILKTVRSVFPNAMLMITGVYTVVVCKKGKFDKFEIENNNFGDLAKIGIKNEHILKSIVFLSPYLFDLLILNESSEILSDMKSSVEFAEFHRRIAENTKPKNLQTILKYSDPLKLSEFTGLDPKNHYSMALAYAALMDYWNKAHYDALKKIEKSLEMFPDNFYSQFLFSLVFPELVEIVRNYEKEIKEKYGDEVYNELIKYIQSKASKWREMEQKSE